MKKIILMLVCISMLLAAANISYAAYDDDVLHGVITEDNDKISYTFALNEPSCLFVNFSSEDLESVNLKIYDEDGQQIWSEYVNRNDRRIAYSKELQLIAGNYEFSVERSYTTGSYELEISSEAVGESFTENKSLNNNVLKAASNIDFNEGYVGQIALNDDVDLYAFNLESSGSVNINLHAENIRNIEAKIYDKNGSEILSEEIYWNNDTSKIMSYSKEVQLTGGDYYFEISKTYYDGVYEFILQQNDVNISSNNSIFITPDKRDEYDDWENEGLYEDEIGNTDTNDFEYDASDWAMDEIEEASQKGLIPHGFEDYSLDEIISREKFAAVAVQLYEKLADTEAVMNYTTFNDIDYCTYKNEIQKAFTLEITDGIGDTTFEPYWSITREQLATMLYRAMKKYWYPEWTIDEDYLYYDIPSYVKFLPSGTYFRDYAVVSFWASDAVTKMSEMGIIQGFDNNYFEPNQNATIEQSILMSLRIYNMLK